MSTMLQHDEPNEYQKATTARTVNLMVDVSDSALRRVRAGFNPDHVDRGRPPAPAGGGVHHRL